MSAASAAVPAAALPPAAFDAPPSAEILAAVRRIAQGELAAQARAIDEGAYPADVMHDLGAAGAFRLLASPAGLGDAIEAMAAASEVCTSTGFMMWCQNALAWYVTNSDNAALKARWQEKVTSASQLGGTGLSNPMKSFYGIETLKLKGTRVEGGYTVKGILPWVSNIGPGHLFGAIFAVEGREGAPVMALIDCGDPAVTLKPCEPFLAMDGTGTYGVQVRDLFIPDDMVLADAAMPFVKKIRAGFVLLQAGMAVGLIRDCVAMIEETKAPLGHVNRFLPTQAEDLKARLAAIEAEVGALAATPHDTSDAYWRRILAARLEAGEASVAAAHEAMLHCGARGYVAAHRCQRRLREAYFVAIVTPATKQLRLMLDALPV